MCSSLSGRKGQFEMGFQERNGGSTHGKMEQYKEKGCFFALKWQKSSLKK